MLLAQHAIGIQTKTHLGTIFENVKNWDFQSMESYREPDSCEAYLAEIAELGG
jgi:hypothetical protein